MPKTKKRSRLTNEWGLLGQIQPTLEHEPEGIRGTRFKSKGFVLLHTYLRLFLGN